MEDELPWLQCDVLNGTALFVIELSVLHLRNRWTIIFPSMVGLLWTCFVYMTGQKRGVYLLPPTRSATELRNLTSQGSVGAVSSIARTSYSIVEMALLVASITTMLEADHRTWGPMAGIPLLVLGMIRSTRQNRTPGHGEYLPPALSGAPNPKAAAATVVVVHPPPPPSLKHFTPSDQPPPQQQDAHSSKMPAAAGSGDIFKAAIAHLLRTVVFTDTMDNMLSVAAGIIILFGTGSAATLSSPSQLAYRKGSSLLAGIASDEDSGPIVTAGSADSPVVAMMLAMLLLPSTPVFGGGRDLVFRSEFVRRSIQPQHLPVVTSALSAVWYSLLFSLRVATPSVVSWPGVLMLVSCSLRLVNSFKEWEANLRIAWVMISVLLGLVLGQSGAGWVRVGLHAAIGIARCVLVAKDPYVFERMYEKQQYKIVQSINSRLAQDSMFRLDRLRR